MMLHIPITQVTQLHIYANYQDTNSFFCLCSSGWDFMHYEDTCQTPLMLQAAVSSGQLVVSAKYNAWIFFSVK